MNKLLKLGLVSALIGLFCFGLFSQTSFALIDSQASKDAACQGVNLGNGGTCDNGDRLGDVLKKAINIFSIVVGVFAVVMVVIGGLKFILSQGESNNVNSARNTILYAIVGLVIVLFAQFIVRFVLTKTTACPPGQVLKAGVCAKP